ncbi:hypothetical protein G3N95_11840 [Paraburkholderia sp. Tr-20389]|uniref:hypothetical protein n=1 Tax=Paraburkholderia sp. Tr-20389 TaxID=2703903 RepID=UPI001980FF40|nr:hypothetical protein [Paraburkholderia sp. Tr-20389]MBN3753632.1 hypothetical protein [Paraburkholderia sp. Tr-20389]
MAAAFFAGAFFAVALAAFTALIFDAALDVKLTPDEIASLETPYVSHDVVGFQ